VEPLVDPDEAPLPAEPPPADWVVGATGGALVVVGGVVVVPLAELEGLGTGVELVALEVVRIARGWLGTVRKVPSRRRFARRCASPSRALR